MQNRQTDILASRTTYQKYSGQSNVNVTTVTGQPWSSDNLTVTDAGTLTGDRVNPNAHAFEKTLVQRYRGVWGESYVGADGYTRVEGVDSYGPGSPSSGFSLSFDAGVYNAALSRLYEQLRGTVDLAVDVAQLRQTSRMVTNVTRFVDYVRSFHPRRWASKWLEYQYGWRPLAQTVYDSVGLLQKSLPRVFVIESSKTQRETRVTTKSHPAFSAPSHPVVITGEFSNRCRFKVWCVLEANVVQRLGDFTSLNPASLAWELVPYSFVVDWLIDVGGYLRNLETAWMHHSTVKYGFVTRTAQLYERHRIESAYTQSGVIRFMRTYGALVRKMKDRDVLSTAPLPQHPTFELSLGWQRLVSAAALLTSHFNRGGR